MDDRGQRSSVYHFNKKETETRTKTFIFKTKSVFFSKSVRIECGNIVYVQIS